MVFCFHVKRKHDSKEKNMSGGPWIRHFRAEMIHTFGGLSSILALFLPGWFVLPTPGRWHVLLPGLCVPPPGQPSAAGPGPSGAPILTQDYLRTWRRKGQRVISGMGHRIIRYYSQSWKGQEVANSHVYTNDYNSAVVIMGCEGKGGKKKIGGNPWRYGKASWNNLTMVPLFYYWTAAVH